MPRITLPDKSVREFDKPVTAAEVAADIGAGLAKAVIGAKIDGELCDSSTLITNDVEIELITAIDRKLGESNEDALFLLRHMSSCTGSSWPP